MKFDNHTYNMDIDEIKDLVFRKKPTLILGPKFFGKSDVYKVLKAELNSITNLKVIELKLNFIKKNMHTQLMHLFKLDRKLPMLEDYIINSSIFNTPSCEFLLYFNNIQNLENDEILWLFRNYIQLNTQYDILNEKNISLLIEGTLSYDQINSNGISPYPQVLKYPIKVDKNKYTKYLNDILNKKTIHDNSVQKLIEITEGDKYFTEKISNKLVQNDIITIDHVIDAYNEYCKEGCLGDELKWYILDTIYRLLGKNYNYNIETLFNRIDEDWNDEDSNFKELIFLGGLAYINQRQIKIRCPNIIKRLSSFALIRVKRFKNLYQNQIKEKILKKDQRERIDNLYHVLLRDIYFGFISNLIIGQCKRISDTLLEINGILDYQNIVLLNWKNTIDLQKQDEGYIIIFDKQEYFNSKKREYYIFTINEQKLH